MSLIIEANAINVEPCDFCPMVHVNLRDADGVVFASGGLPVELCEAFIAQIRAAMKNVAERPRATVKRQ